MHKMFEEFKIRESILSLILQKQIQAVGFVPPTIPRKIQFQKELQRFLNLPLPHIQIDKIKTEILVPQKTLNKVDDRILNSKTTFVIPKPNHFENILLIDDFAGSASTLNFIAQKIKQKTKNKENTKIYGLALCGTPNGVVNNSNKFEVVKEV